MNGQRTRRLGFLATASVAAALLIAAPAEAAKPSSGGSWGTGTAVSPVEQPDPTRGSQLNDVAVNASGLALAAWDRFSYNNGGGATIGAAVETAGRWSAPVTFGTTGYSMSPRVAVSPKGDLAVSWTYQDSATQPSPYEKKQVAVRRAGSTTWETTTLASQPVGGTQGLAIIVPVAFDAAGNLTAAWSIWNGKTHDVQVATLPKGGAWSTATTLEPSFDGISPALVVNSAGAAAVAYATSPYTSTGSTAIRYAYRSTPLSGWATPVTVSETVPWSVGYASSPSVGLDVAGIATVAWFGSGVEASRQRADGTWTGPTTVVGLMAAGSSYSAPDLAVDDAGNAVLALWIFDATINVDRSSAWVSRGTAAGTWGTPQRLTDPAVPVDAYAAQAAISPDGKLAVVGWVDHYHGTVQAARLDTATGKWVTSTVGKGTAFSSFQEVIAINVASSSVARIAWKYARGGTQTMVADYRP